MAEARIPGRSARPVTEVPADGLPALVHPEWRDRFPWLVQGMTTRGSAAQAFDLGLFSGGSAADAVSTHWSLLARATDSERICHAKQVHGGDVAVHAPVARWGAAESLPLLVDPCDGHVTAEVGTLLTVATADCVPVFAVDEARGVAGVFHAGWRGVVAGVVENGLDSLSKTSGADGEGDPFEHVHVHLGPAICGSCYEVGPEVFEALRQAVPAAPTPIDLRSVIAQRVERSGVRLDRVTVSTHCTRCTGSDLFSHRGGDRGRQVGFIGMRGAPGTRRDGPLDGSG